MSVKCQFTCDSVLSFLENQKTSFPEFGLQDEIILTQIEDIIVINSDKNIERGLKGLRDT